MNEDNLKIKEFAIRNQKIVTKYLEDLLKVEVTAYSKTTEEKSDFDLNLSSYTLPPNKNLLILSGFKPFYDYGDLIIDSINKIAKNEKRLDVVFKKDETLNHDKWIKRIGKTKDGNIWILQYNTLLSFVKDIHDGRVKKLRDEIIK